MKCNICGRRMTDDEVEYYEFCCDECASILMKHTSRYYDDFSYVLVRVEARWKRFVSFIRRLRKER